MTERKCKTIIVFCLAIVMSFFVAWMMTEAETLIGKAPDSDKYKVIIVDVRRPVNEELNGYMTEDLQEYIWNLCARRYTGKQLKEYYSCMIGLAQGESEFNPKATNYHGDSCDRGLYQINSKNVSRLKKAGLITSAEDLYDPYASARCGEYIFWEGYKEKGYSEQSYTRYLYGDKKERSNRYTKRVWGMMQGWYGKLWK